MSNKILIKRGLKSSMPTLDVGELGLATDTSEMFIGTINGNKLVNSGGGGDGIDSNTLGYMVYASDIFYRGGHQSLFSNAWTNHNKRTTLFDENISFVVSDSSLGYPLSFYSGNNVDELYDFLASGGVRPEEVLKITVNNIVFDATSPDSVTTTGVALRFVGDQSDGLGLPTPVYVVADEENIPFLIVVNATELGIPLGKVIAFINNENVTTLKIESGFNHYYKNGIIIPDGVEVVPIYSYSGSTGFPVIDNYFKSNDFPLVIPNSVTSIGNHAFRSWTSNNQPLVIPNSVTSIGEYAFWSWTSNNQPLVIPNSVTKIGIYAFSDWQQVPYVVIKAEVPPTLGNLSAFGNQNNAPIYVPDGSVDDYKNATNWSALSSRIFPMSGKDAQGGGIDMNDLPYMTQVSGVLASLGRYDELETAWNNQENFTVSASGDMTGYTEQDPHVLDIVIPRNVKSIPNYTIDSKPFKKNNYTSITLPNGVTSIGDYAFSEWTSINHPLVIPNSVTSIGRYAFSSWYNNNQPLVIPNSVTSIGNNAFREWYYNNQPLVIPDSVISIGDYAFYRWNKNNHPLVIPDSVTIIGRAAFSSWNSTPYAEIHATTPPTLEYAGLEGSYPIYVPDGSVDDYKNATNWSALSSRIFAISEK